MRRGGRDRALVVAIAITAIVGAVVELTGLGRRGGDAWFTDGARHVDAPPEERFVAWSPPEPAFDRPSSGDTESGVAVTADGRTVVWALGTPGENVDLWLAERGPDGQWSARRLDEVSSDRDDVAPCLSPDGATLVFASDRPGGHGGFDLWVAQRRGARFLPARNAGAVVNSTADDVDPCVAPTGALVFASRRSGRYDLLVAQRGADGWHAPATIDGVNTAADERAPALSPDGRTLWFASNRAGGAGGFDIYKTVQLHDAWLPAAPLAALNTAADESDPSPTDAGFTLWFARDGALLRAQSRELFRWSTPQRSGLSRVGSLIVVLLILLMVFYLARRWAEMGILGRSVVASLIAHLILFLYLSEVMVAGGIDVPNGERRYRVTMARAAPASRAAEQARGDAPAVVSRATEPVVVRDAASLRAARPDARALSRADRRSPAAPSSTPSMRDATRPAPTAAQAATRVPDAPTRRARPAVVDAARSATAVAPGRRAPTRPARRDGPPESTTIVARKASVAAPRSTAVPALDAPPRTPGARRAPTASATRLARPVEPTRVARAALPGRSTPNATSVPIARRDVESRPSRAVPEATPRPAIAAASRTRAAPSPIASPARLAGPVASPRPIATRGATPAGSAVALATPKAPSRSPVHGSAPSDAARAPTATTVARQPIDLPARRQADPARTVVAATPGARPAATRLPPPSAVRSRSPARERSGASPRPTVALAVPARPNEPAPRAEPTPSATAVVEATPTSVTPRPRLPDRARATPSTPRAVPRVARAVPPRAAPTRLPVVANRSPSRRPMRAVPGTPSSTVVVRRPELSTRAHTRVVEPTRSAPAVRAVPIARRSPPPPERSRPAPPPAHRVDAVSLARAHAAAPRLVTERRQQRAAVARATGLFDRRAGDAKLRALRDYGGTEASEAAVRNGLAYLARIQHDTGAWGDPDYRHRKYGYVDVGKTALCALAFLGSGHTPQSKTRYSDVTTRAIRFLLSQQNARGHIGRGASYGHGIATYALAEAYAMTRDPSLRAPLMRAVGRILDAQNLDRGRLETYGGWGYFYAGDRVWDDWPRASVTAWQVMALKSARLGGIAVPDEALAAARAYLRNAYDREAGSFRYSHDPDRLRSAFRTLPGSTPASMFALLILGEDPGTERIRQGTRYVMDRIPTTYQRTGDRAFVLQAKGNLYFWYYATLALFTTQGDAWTTWNAHLRDLLVGAQCPDGSWLPISPYARYANDNRRDRSYTTALCVLMLEVYYRYVTPLLTHRPVPAAPALPDEIRSPAMAGHFEVRALDDGGAAARAGVRVGDRLHRYAGRVVTDFDTLRTWIRRHANDATVALEVVRDGVVVTLTVDGGPLGVRIRAP